MKQSKAKTAAQARTGPEVIDVMQGTVTLDRFYDRNPWKEPDDTYLKRVVEVNRRQRTERIAKGEPK